MAEKIYRHPTQPKVDVPQLDLLTFLFDSPENGLAQDDTVLHVDASDPANEINKVQLRALVERMAHGFRHKYDVGADGPGRDVVTVISHGQILLPAVFFGIIAAGGVYSASSPTSTASELARQVEQGRSRLIICGSEQETQAREAASRCGLPASRVLLLDSRAGGWSLTSLEGEIQALSPETKRLPWTPIRDDPKALRESLIMILWSSGTTGLPKGVMLSHLNLVSETHLVSLSARQWAMAEIERLGGPENFNPPPFRTLAHLPTSHIAGAFGYLIHPLYSGGTVIWMRKYRWADMLDVAERHRITFFYTVPSIYLRISKAKGAEGEKVRRAFALIEAASTGAAPMDGELQASANSVLGEKGSNSNAIFIGQTWGLSETTGAVTAQPRDMEPDATGSISPPLPGVELRLVDPDTMEDIANPAEVPGELLIRAPMVTRGYFGNEEATRDAFYTYNNNNKPGQQEEEPWFRSGDLAVMRNGGKFYIVDRMKEILKYKGLQIAPAELENLLFTHPAVAEAAVVGIPAPNDPGTEWPRAYVVLSSSSGISSNSSNNIAINPTEIQEWVAERVPQHKQLRGGVVFVEEIPKNSVGKFLRRELRERAKKEVAKERGGVEGGAKL